MMEPQTIQYINGVVFMFTAAVVTLSQSDETTRPRNNAATYQQCGIALLVTLILNIRFFLWKLE